MSHRFPPLLAVAAFVLFAAWSLIVPVHEAPDEPAHWQYARHLHDHWTLPIYRPGFEEANSPPLAYALYAPFAVEIGSPDMVIGRRPNGDIVSLAGTRMFLNTGEDYGRYWPLRVGRLLSAAISVGTVIFTYRAGLAAGGREIGLLAALALALLPMFAWRAGHVSNDALVACMAAAATWGFVRLVREPFAWRVAWWTSAAIGLAYMAKISAISLLPPFALALVLAEPAASWTLRAWRLSAFALAGAIVAPWSLRNIVLYGDPFASEAMRTAVAHIITDRPLFSRFFVTDFPKVLAKSFVGIFGWANLLLPRFFYWAYLTFFGVGFAAGGWALLRRRVDWRLVAVLLVAGLASLAVVVRINLQFTQMQGRYLLPGLPAFAVLLAMGLRALPAAFARVTSPAAVGGVLAAANLYALGAVAWPAYHPAPLRTLASGERVMVPTILSELAVARVPDVEPDDELHFVVTGKLPEWMTKIEAQADRFGAFEVELTATATPAPQRACVYFATDTRRMHESPPSCVDWVADGKPHVVRMPLRGRPGWSGFVTHLRLDPFEAGTGVPGVEIWTRRPRLLP